MFLFLLITTEQGMCEGKNGELLFVFVFLSFCRDCCALLCFFFLFCFRRQTLCFCFVGLTEGREGEEKFLEAVAFSWKEGRLTEEKERSKRERERKGQREGRGELKNDLQKQKKVLNTLLCLV